MGRSKPTHGAVKGCICAQPELGLGADPGLWRAASVEVRGLDTAALLIFAGPQMCVSEPQLESEGTVWLFG